MSGIGTKWTFAHVVATSAFDPKQTLPGLRKRLQCMRDEMISTMRAARPTTGPSLSAFEAGTAPFDPASSCFRPFCRLDPADPFIAREGRNVLPRLQRLRPRSVLFSGLRAGHGPHRLRSLFAQNFTPKRIAEVRNVRGRDSKPRTHAKSAVTFLQRKASKRTERPA